VKCDRRIEIETAELPTEMPPPEERKLEQLMKKDSTTVRTREASGKKGASKVKREKITG
jgi:hypothetical protein